MTDPRPRRPFAPLLRNRAAAHPACRATALVGRSLAFLVDAGILPATATAPARKPALAFAPDV